jgi:hypothetical protein
VRHLTDVGLCTPGEDQDVVGSSAPSDTGSDRLVRWAYAGFPFPVGWLALVAASALIGGAAIGFLAPDTLRPWVVGSAGAGLLLGALGGALWLAPGKVAWMGAAVWSVVLSISAHVAWYRGSVPEDEAGGLGQVIGFVFVITVVPLFAGALIGRGLRRAPLATSAVVLGAPALLTCLVWLTLKLLNIS